MQVAADAVIQAITAPVGARFLVRTQQKIRLGSLTVCVQANEESFAQLQYFPQSTWLAATAAVDYCINCCNIGIDGPWPTQQLCAARDRTYRGGRFAAGY